MIKYSYIGIIGLGVMGASLAQNFEEKGLTVSVYNRPHKDGNSKVEEFIKGNGGKNFFGTENLKDFVGSLKSPKIIMLMVKAGSAVDDMVDELLPFLAKGDVIIDGGNSDYHDTQRRVEQLEAKGILFVGAGVSGGEEGARNGASIMVGGNEEAWPKIKSVLKLAAAKNDDGSVCCRWIGKGGAGHFVKMVHNGIEYADMQLIAEVYGILKFKNLMADDEIGKLFDSWATREFGGYLIEITGKILSVKDKDGKFLVEKILDSAAQKGTGKWTVDAALDYATPFSLVAEAVFCRFLSAMKNQRESIAKIYSYEPVSDAGESPEAVAATLFASKIIAYAQGFELMRNASIQNQWNLNFAGIAKIWRKGCIIRSPILDRIAAAFENPQLENLLMDDFFKKEISLSQLKWRKVIANAILSGMPIPCLAAAVTYFDSIRTANSTANLIQAQRDFFGAHTYRRIDDPSGKFFHTDWESMQNPDNNCKIIKKG